MTTAASHRVGGHDQYDVHQVAELAERLTASVGRVIRGKREVIERAVLALLTEGHLLVQDVPGTGKTTLAKALADSLGGSFARIQFTPDLLPSDVTGTSIYDARSQDFSFRPGPVFANVLLADEINRASPKTQSALLEVMQERQVTVDGEPLAVPRPFLVLATQNPMDADGTYPLPQAQLDRFAIRIAVGYPGQADERDLLLRHGREIDGAADGVLSAVADPTELLTAGRVVRGVHVSPELADYLVDLVTATRRHPDVQLGASPRAALTWLGLAKGRAAVQRRAHVLPEDLKDCAAAVLGHRLVLTSGARTRRVTEDDVIDQLLHEIEVPSARSLRAL